MAGHAPAIHVLLLCRQEATLSPPVMAGLVPAIHVFLRCSTKKQDVDARHEAGHDEEGGAVLHANVYSLPKIRFDHQPLLRGPASAGSARMTGCGVAAGSGAGGIGVPPDAAG
jgi:hypothetical protein